MAGKTSINQTSVIKYMALPGILPRIGKLLGGFKNLAYFIAVVFNTLRILPDNHPFLRAENHGTYSVYRVLIESRRHLVFDRRNIDKVTIFFVVLLGLVLLALQFVLCIFALFTGNAFAGAATYNGPSGPTETSQFFADHNPAEDLAFRALDLVFGVPGIFDSKSLEVTPFHTGLHALFEFYSFGMLLVGSLVIIYLATAIVLETAQTGVPFGERFNKAWAPVRLILFFGLLLPTSTYGLNFAQYIVLNAAKLGSNLATNAWIGFDEAIEGAGYLGNPEQMIAEPNMPNLSSLVSFMQLAKTCQFAEGKAYGRDVQPYVVFGNGAQTTTGEGVDRASQSNAVELVGNQPPAFADFSQKANGGTLFIRFGVQDAALYASEPGAVFPFCGELALTIVDQAQPGATVMQQAYLELVACLWHGEYFNVSSAPAIESPACRNTLSATRAKTYTQRYMPYEPENAFPDMSLTEWGNARTNEIWYAQNDMNRALGNAREEQIANGEWLNDAAMKYGWAGAGIWFNKIAEQNGALTSAVYAKPEIVLMPYVMEYVKRQKLREDSTTPMSALYTPDLASGSIITFEDPQQREVLIAINQLFAYWGSDNTSYFLENVPETHNTELTGNVIIDVMNVFMGTRGLFDMCKNTDVHPLAQLTSLGKGLVEHSIRGFALAAGTGIGGGLLGMFEKFGFKQVLQTASSFLVSFAGIGLVLGFILYYVVPFLPFIYFFFAFMTWVKSIFEAMVGMPLWALAHLNIGGQGMPGDAAASGYFHILEIFLRPILILVGLMGGVAIFAAMVKVLNQVFYLVLSNLAGHYVTGDTGCFAPPGVDSAEVMTEANFVSGTIDEFFYTVIYTIIVYLFAIPCFKLVDMIPDHVMTWLGAGISTFGSQDGDPADGLMRYVSIGAAGVGSNLQQGFGGAMGKLSKAMEGLKME